MSTIAERLSAVDTKLNNILTNANTQLTNKGKTAVSDLSDLPSAVGELKNPTGTKSITQNGTVDVSQYASANVNVPTPTPNLQSKSVTITENGTTTITADSGYDGLNGVEVTTNVSGGGSQAVLPNGIMFQGSQVQDMSWLEDVDTTQIIDMLLFFYNCSNLQIVPLFDTSNVTTMESSFQGCLKIQNMPLLNTGNVTNMRNMFNNCNLLTTVPLFNTSKVTSMANMFYNCYAITSIPNFDTSALQLMQSMFYNCSLLTTVPSFNTNKVTNMYNAFSGCGRLSNDSLNNILLMCANATSYTGTKTLKYIGLTSTQANNCTQLSNWASAQSAGWSKGY